MYFFSERNRKGKNHERKCNDRTSRPSPNKYFLSFSKTNTTQPKVYLFFIWNSIVVLTSHRKCEMLVNKHALVGEHKAFITNEFQIISGGDHEMFREEKKG